jgi:hypothetical protein
MTETLRPISAEDLHAEVDAGGVIGKIVVGGGFARVLVAMRTIKVAAPR